MSEAFADADEGAGVVPTRLAFSAYTGQLTALTTFSSGTLDSSGAAETTWDYDPMTGFLSGKSYDGSTSADIEYVYEALKLTGIERPGSEQAITYDAETKLWSGSSWGAGEPAYEVEGRDDKGHHPATEPVRAEREPDSSEMPVILRLLFSSDPQYRAD